MQPMTTMTAADAFEHLAAGKSFLLALAAGGILAMLADTMFPEAFREGGPWVALATTIGFAIAFLLSDITG